MLTFVLFTIIDEEWQAYRLGHQSDVRAEPMLSDTAAGRVKTMRSHADASSQIPWLSNCHGYGIETGTVV